MKNDKSFNLRSDDGFALATLAIASLDEGFKDFYKQGYKEGKLMRKGEVIAEGFQSDFVDMNNDETKTHDNPKLIS